MTKEELIELKNKIEYEQELSKKKTGYPTIDKPWEKYYNKEELNVKRPKRTVYQEIYDNNHDYVNDLALEFFGKCISFGELFENIDKTAKSLSAYGVKDGDIVTVCCAGIPETIYTFYALSKIGAAANLMSPYFDKDDMVNRINDCDSKVLIVMDKFYPEIKESVKKSCIEKIVVVPTLNSSLLGLFQKKLPIDYENEVYWKDFIKFGSRASQISAVKYEEGKPLALVYSSGTTGAAKAILLTNDSFQNSIQAYPASGVDLSRGQKFYQIIPPWYSTGLSTSIHLPLSYGVSVFMDPRFDRKHFVKNVIKHKPNYAVAATSIYEGFLDKKLVGRKSLKHFNYPFEGGEPLSESQAKKIEQVFAEHGSDAKLRTAYGECECGAAITTEVQGIDHPYGCVGIPLPGITIGIFDENYNELPYYTRGEILADTPCGMKEYYKNPEATRAFFYVDDNGVKWSCTGDIGYIDENGNLFIEGRKNDYTLVNGKKVYNFDVEKIISEISGVKFCDVMINNKENCLTAHLILEDEMKKQVNNDLQFGLDYLIEIQNIIYKTTNDINMVPKLFKIRDEFPCAKSGKRNVEAMKNEIDGFIKLETELLSSEEKQYYKD